MGSNFRACRVSYWSWDSRWKGNTPRQQRLNFDKTELCLSTILFIVAIRLHC